MIYNEIKFWIVFTLIIGIIVYIFDNIISESKNYRTLKEKKMLLDVNISSNYMDIVDSIINDSVIKYRALNIDHDKNFYMNQKEQEKMISTVLQEVLSSISPVFYEQVSLIYNKDKFEDIVFEKITMAVLSVTVDINGNYKEI